MLTPKEVEEIEAEASHYPQRQAAGIDALRIVQEHRGYVSDEALKDVAALLGRTEEELDGVATFYNLIFRRPVGRHVVLVCDSVVCWTLGYERLQEALIDRLGIGLGETTADGRFTLLPSVCLGACDHAPVLMIDEDTHLDVDPEQVDSLLEGYR